MVKTKYLANFITENKIKTKTLLVIAKPLATIREKLNVIETEKNFQNYLRAYLLAYRKHQKFSL